LALSATFKADFTQFDEAVKRGVSNLQQLDTVVTTSTRQFQRELSSLRGDRLVAETGRMVQAVNEIGGVSKLTSSELQRLRDSLDRTTEKARLMGTQVPPEFAKMRSELEKLPKPIAESASGFSTLTGALAKFGPLIGVASIGAAGTALVGFAKSAMQSASEITDLANKTGLSTRAIQEMQQVASQTGSSLEAFTSAAFKLGVNISEGGGKAKQSIAELGLQYDLLKASSPDEQFRAVIAALEGVDSQTERNRLGVNLFGRQFSEIAAAVQEGYSDIADAATIATDQQLRALDAASDAITQFKTNLSQGVVMAMGSLLTQMQNIERGADSLSNSQKGWLMLSTLWGRNYLEELRNIGIELDLIDRRARDQGPPTWLRPVQGVGMSPDEQAAAERRLTSAVRDQMRTREDASRKQSAAQAAAKRENDAFWASVQRLNQQTVSYSVTLQNLNTNIGETEFFGKSITRVFDEQARAAGVLTQKFLPLKASVKEMRPELVEAEKTTRQWSSSLGGLAQAFSFLSQNAGGLGGTVQWIASTVSAMHLARQASDQMAEAIKRIRTEGKLTADSFASVVTATVSGAAAIAAATGQGQSRGKNVASGALAGMQAGAFAGVVGMGVGAGVGALVGLFRETGAEKQIKAANEQLARLREGLLETHGSLYKLEQMGAAVGLSFQAQWGHKGTEGLKQFNAFLKEMETRTRTLNKDFGELFAELKRTGEGLPEAFIPVIDHLLEIGVLSSDLASQFKELSSAPGFADMQKAAEALGVRLESLGPAFDAKKLAHDADEVLKHLTILARGGADIGGVLADAAPKMNELVLQALRLGTELPEPLRKYIEELQRAGMLVDENGDALMDLSKLNWAEPMSRSVDRLIDKFSELIELLASKLAPTLANLPMPNLNIPLPVIPMAAGGAGVVSKPTLFLAGEAGPEHVSFRPVGQGSGGGNITVQNILDGRIIGDFVIDRLGNRLAVRGAR
jgi:hypothetical protein